MSVSVAAVTVVVPGSHLMASLLGERDAYLRLIEKSFPSTSILVRGNEIMVSGDNSDLVGRLFEELTGLLQGGENLDLVVVSRCFDMVRSNERPTSVLTEDVVRGSHGKPVRAKTSGQKRYVDAIQIGRAHV